MSESLVAHRRWGNKGYDESDPRRRKPRWERVEPPEEPYSGNGHIGRRPPPPAGCGTVLLWPLSLLWRR